MSLRFALATDTGLHRENNEDAARAVPELELVAVADGMGGHIAGEVASQVAIDTFVAAVADHPRPRRVRDEREVLLAATLAANDAVLREAADRDLLGMGTTLTGLRVHSRSAVIAHVGDSRAYFVRSGKLDQVTTDHTMVEMLVASGAIPPEQAHEHPERHLLIQAIGTQPILRPDVLQLRIPRGARILLSTDGLHDHVAGDDILALALDPDLDKAVHDLIQAANDAGGPDNITVALVDP